MNLQYNVTDLIVLHVLRTLPNFGVALLLEIIHDISLRNTTDLPQAMKRITATKATTIIKNVRKTSNISAMYQ